MPSEKETHGIESLPKKWQGAVQIVSTFGLAVFLVLYYVLIIRKEDNQRYEKLSQSVDALVQIVEKQGSLVDSSVQSRLEDIYVDAAGREIADIIATARKTSLAQDKLATRIQQSLVARTSLFQGLYRKDGRSVSELIINRVQNFDFPKELASYASEEWKDLQGEELARQARRFLQERMHYAASAK